MKKKPISTEQLIYAQAVLFVIGTVFFLGGSSIALGVATRNLKKSKPSSKVELF